ncbi:hypothetical protein PHMEG_00034201 [Phytophthora megakarya]|uniref:Uncharacterized protein n=1 Tax=Phytophthora megakarya TaxID=4795 RepID=A0A225URV3_9STRA|nr:hypothetical protein PHMEG_00034201 [Phytophthora megakarya]
MQDTDRSTAGLQTALHELFESLQTKSLASSSGKQYSSTLDAVVNLVQMAPLFQVVTGGASKTFLPTCLILTPEPEILHPPCSRNLATSRGIIVGCLDTALPFYPDKACDQRDVALGSRS